MADKQNLAKESQLALKQDTLIAGANITIAPDGKTISAAGPTSITVTPIYQAGTLVAAIVVNGNTTNIYAPAQHGDNSNQNLAAPFSASATYAVGNYVIYQENLYKCITAITTAAAWDATKWTRVLITNEMGSGSGGDYANQNIADTYDITSTYDVGDYVIFNSLLYKCITAVTTPGVWNSSYWAHVLVTNEMGSGGGSSVIPNPQDPATDTLTTIGINGTVYDIAGGGGGSGYTETTLWSGNETPSVSGTDINLSENISDYDAIAIHVGNSSYTGDNVFLVSSLTIGETYISTIYHGENLGAYFTYTSDTQINIKRQATSYPQIYTEVIGIKYGSGGGGGTTVVPNPSGTPTDTLNTVEIDNVIYDLGGGGGSGSGYEETVLWTGPETPNMSSTITLNDNLSNYDMVYFNVHHDYYTNEEGSALFAVSSLAIGGNYISTLYDYDKIYVCFEYTSDTQLLIKTVNSGNLTTYTEIVGIKFKGGSGGGGVSFDEDILLNTQTEVSSGSSIQLTSSIFDYDLIIIDTSTGSYTDWREHIFMDVSQITLNTEYTRMVLRTSSDTYGLRYKFTANNTIYAWGDGSRNMIIYKITGVKFNSSGGGGNSNDRELTWDEYQALPDAEKYNDTNYYITDVNSDGTSNEFQPIIYSENEREIGVWTDGKPLYSQTFTGQINNTTIYTIPNITVDNLISFNGFLIDGVGYKFNIPYRDNTDYISIRLNPTNAIDLIVTSYFTTADYKINLCYTKTTDRPGSGTWTPQGVPAVHYDDNEKVIGTWFGETLYERVYDFSSSPIYIDTSYTTISAIDTTNIDKVIYCCAMHQDGTVYPAVDADPTRDNHTYMGLKSFDSHSNVAYVIIRYTKSSS